jgi:hypothetical protein
LWWIFVRRFTKQLSNRVPQRSLTVATGTTVDNPTSEHYTELTLLTG